MPDPAPTTSDTVAATWGPIVVSGMAMVLFFAAICVAWWTKDASLPLLLGAAATNAATVVSYWLGSSSGSKRKDQVIAGMSGTPTVTGTTTTVGPGLAPDVTVATTTTPAPP